MKKKYKRVYSISLEPGYRNYTVRDLIENKGKMIDVDLGCSLCRSTQV